ncbi:PDZ domain-containing protein [Gemmata sp. G18]|uniref:PDZ domain-containing protein n=1 Tax=Gemmata palustris TaxID=2822762 RepID=A0ABS5C3G3_9BACT|nr:PDZ domain-containing protein [Gemmata palustris]MBP3960533.1 PDZ domain-containing protein [Gemmata palustris]
MAVPAPLPGVPQDSKAPRTAVTLEAPPRELAGALAELKGADAQKRLEASRALAQLPDAEPYIRHYRTTDAGKDNTRASESLALIDAERAKRNMKRVPQWAKAGRYDLLVDTAIHLPEPDDANTLAKLLMDFAEAIRPVPQKLGGPEAKHFLDHIEVERLRQFHEPRGKVTTDHIGHAYVRAQSCDATNQTRFYWLTLTRDELKGTTRNSLWENCYLFHNGDLTLDSCTWSLVVCDGNIDFVNAVDGGYSTIIARESIRSQKGLGCTSSTFYAQGDIVAKGTNSHNGLLLAGGKVDVPIAKVNGGNKQTIEKGGVKENPFGLRFFETADLGAEAALKGQALTIAKLTPGSPLTKYDIREGDVVTRVNDKVIKTANDFRRELRYSVALEAGIFHITRGNEKINRIVYFKNGLEK